MSKIIDNWAKILLIILSLINLALMFFNISYSFLPEMLTFDHTISLLIPVVLFPRIEFLQVAPVFKDTKYKTIDFIFIGLFALTYVLYSAKLITFLF